MRILVIHQNFPGQFGHLVKAWAQRPGWEVRALGRDTAPGLAGFNGLMRYSLAREGNATSTLTCVRWKPPRCTARR